MAKLLKIKSQITKDQLKVVTVDGQKITSTGKAEEVIVKILDQPTKADFYIIPSDGQTIILTMD